MRRRTLQIVGGVAVASALLIGPKVALGRNEEKTAAIPELHIQPPDPSGIPWDHNWDRRAPESTIHPPKANTKPEDYERKLEEAQPTAVRNLLLVRHGQYQDDSKEKWLTDLGREQAELAGKYLQSLNLPVSKIIWSTKNRATETGRIISKYFIDVPTESCELLEEGIPPAVAEPEHPTWKPSPSMRFVEGARMEAAFRKYFHRAPPSQVEDSYEIVACHGNVIRYCILRALQLPPSAWLNLSAYNASITWVQIAPNGRVCLLTFGDTGFIPPEKITFWLRNY